MEGLDIREVSFIHPSENIGKLNPLNVVAGDASKRKESGEESVPIVPIILSMLLSHQYDMSFAEEFVVLKQL